jgi:hypothetical protein
MRRQQTPGGPNRFPWMEKMLCFQHDLFWNERSREKRPSSIVIDKREEDVTGNPAGCLFPVTGYAAQRVHGFNAGERGSDRLS